MVMKLSRQIKPISYLKAHAAEIIRSLAEQGEPLVITQNGEAKVVMQDIESYEQMQETMALLKILALGSQQIDAGRIQSAGDVVERLRGRSKAR
jgi:prevent-host-death family protein